MHKHKLQSEKLEVIKRLIRQNNYLNHDKTYEQCSEIGFNVNPTSLARFSEKLELLDRLEESKLSNDGSATSFMSYEQIKERERAITFELGELKIRENKLMEELTSLSRRLAEKD